MGKYRSLSNKGRVIIGLIGYIGSGKTTVAEILQELGVEAIALADPLKSLVHDTFLMQDEMHLRDDQEWKMKPNLKLGGWTPRKVYQFIGTECFRLIQPDVWVDYARNRIRTSPELQSKDIVVTDIRFPNEARMVTELGGYLWLIDRPREVKPEPWWKHLMFWRRNKVHESESYVDQMREEMSPFIIDNSGSLGDLADKVSRRFKQLKGEVE